MLNNMLTVEWISDVFLHVNGYIAIKLFYQSQYVRSAQLIFLKKYGHLTYHHSSSISNVRTESDVLEDMDLIWLLC